MQMSPDDNIKLPHSGTDAHLIACSMQGVIRSVQMVHGHKQGGGALSSLDIETGEAKLLTQQLEWLDKQHCRLSSANSRM